MVFPEVRREEERAQRGKLTIFFGSAPGVGKTYAMLESARLEREEGRDVVVGLVETHGRYDTGALLLGLEILPRRKLTHRADGVIVEELDLDAALRRRPGLVLVDDLAHTNAAGSRHSKRWQDVEELLSAGLDVYTTLNVQHLESLNDVIAQITHIVIKETVPDSVFEAADDVRLIDLPINELLERMNEGKVCLPELAARAKETFFREGNLIALRELALRLTAQRVDAQMRRYREQHGLIDRTWAATERVLVCVSPSPASERLVRGARRLAGSLHADWIAAFVETPSLRLSNEDRRRIGEHLRLAESLGATTVTLNGQSGAEEIIRHARQKNVTRIVVGKPTHASWRDRLRPSFLDQLVRRSDDIEVHVLTGERPSSRRAARSSSSPDAGASALPTAGFAAVIAVIASTTVLGQLLFRDDQLADVVMIYLLGIVVVSLRWGLAPSLLAAVLSVFALDFFFIPPFHTLAVRDTSHVATFAVMFIVATVISGLTKRVRAQAEAAREREARTAGLYSLSGALSRAKTTHDVALAGAQHVFDVFGARAVILVPRTMANEKEDRLVELTRGDTSTWAFHPNEREMGVAEWTWQNGKPAGADTDTLPSSIGSYVPLEASGARVGVLGVEAHATTRAPPPTDLRSERNRHHLAAFARQIADALQRTHFAERAQQAQLRIEAEQLRNSLLSSVSHDLRTPLAVITGAASTLRDAPRLEDAVRRDLTDTILSEAEILHRLVRNLLDMTRLEAGAVDVKKEWQPIEEAVGAALERSSRVLGDRPIVTDLPLDLPLVPYDSILLQQVLVNLLENAAKYTPPDAEVSISARAIDSGVEVEVADRGPGLPRGEESKIFGKFYRAEKGRGGGVGLGLTICKGIITAHGGRIWAETRDPDKGGGASFHFTLPITGSPPSIAEDGLTTEQERERAVS